MTIRWICSEEDVANVKNRMFYQDKNGYVFYVLRQDRKPIVQKDEEIFFDVLMKPIMFESPGDKYATYKMKAAIAWWNGEKWLSDNELLTIRLTKKDYDFLTKLKVNTGDRLSIMERTYDYKNAFDERFVKRTITWKRVKKGYQVG